MGLYYSGNKYYKKQNRIPEINRQQLKIALLLLSELAKASELKI